MAAGWCKEWPFFSVLGVLRRGDAVASYGFKEVPSGHQLLDADLWGRSRATGRALGCVCNGVTAFTMATKVREIVSSAIAK